MSPAPPFGMPWWWSNLRDTDPGQLRALRLKSMIIRRFENADADAVWSLHRRALEKVGAPAPDERWEDDLRDIPASYLASGGEFLVGHIDAALVAMSALRPISSNRVELKRMRVEPTRQGQGLGKKLLEALVVSAQKMGITEVELETTAGQQAARKLYEAAGFEVYSSGQGHGYDVVRYVRTI
jgi:ribosomal protein S18 acetylase RimI-like enzyme